MAIIYGGRSGEHEISLRSAKSIIAALDPDKYKVLHYVISKEGRWSPRSISPEPRGNPEIDVVFPVLHGTFGEDGTVQGLLELAELPYVGAGVLASAVSMDKEVMKRLAVERGLPVADYMVMRRALPNGRASETSADRLPDHESLPGGGTLPRRDREGALADACQHLGFPMFVKPANLGSSVGITKARDSEQLRAAIDTAFQFDRKIIIERAIIGREFECSVLGNEEPVAAVPCEILPSREFYDYEDKYLLDAAQTVLPADLTPEQTAEVRRLAVECYRAVECEGMARVDFLLENATGKFYINEINTIPGFTSISMYPKMWENCGLPMPKLLDRLIELALERAETKKKLRYSR